MAKLLSSVDIAWDTLQESYADFIRGAPEGEFTRQMRARRRLRLDTYGHYPLHAEAIRHWRARRATSEGRSG